MDATLLPGLYQSFGICGPLTRLPALTSHSYRFADDVIARRDGHDASRSTVLSFGRRVNGGRLKATDRIRANSMRLGIALSC